MTSDVIYGTYLIYSPIVAVLFLWIALRTYRDAFKKRPRVSTLIYRFYLSSFIKVVLFCLMMGIPQRDIEGAFFGFSLYLAFYVAFLSFIGVSIIEVVYSAFLVRKRLGSNPFWMYLGYTLLFPMAILVLLFFFSLL